MTKPWDSRLARVLVQPFVDTPLHPNHLTTLSLLVGLSGAVSFGLGSSLSIALGAGLYMLSMFLDHTDGELARLSGKTSEFGHRYDRAVDLLVKSAVFAGMGIGVARATGTSEPIWMGLVCGAAFVAIFVGHDQIHARTRMGIPDQPASGGFEIEDILYLIGPITWLGGLAGFLWIASLGAPVYASIVWIRFWRLPVPGR